MDSQEFLPYFIEEANEHLTTIERGLLELKSVAADGERLNELFRAAHSVKGGAGMVGYPSIQKTAHQLEDAFKVLKDRNINVDQQLENLFLGSYNVLKELIDKLQSPYGLADNEADRVLQDAQPAFAQLHNYLQQLSGGGVVAAPAKVEKQAKTTAPSANFGIQTLNILKQMLQLFKQKDTPQNRQLLLESCAQLAKIEANRENWQAVIKASQSAIANPDNSYQVLAPVVIREIKQASDWIQTGKDQDISVSELLQQLAATKAQQISIPVEPKAAAKSILQSFNKQQVLHLIELLVQGSR